MSIKNITVQQTLDYGSMCIGELCRAVEVGSVKLITHEGKAVIGKEIAPDDFLEDNYLYGASVYYDSLKMYVNTIVTYVKGLDSEIPLFNEDGTITPYHDDCTEDMLGELGLCYVWNGEETTLPESYFKISESKHDGISDPHTSISF